METTLEAEQAVRNQRGWWQQQALPVAESSEGKETYRNTVRIFLADALSLSLSLFERVLVLELGSHCSR